MLPDDPTRVACCDFLAWLLDHYSQIDLVRASMPDALCERFRAAAVQALGELQSQPRVGDRVQVVDVIDEQADHPIGSVGIVHEIRKLDAEDVQTHLVEFKFWIKGGGFVRDNYGFSWYKPEHLRVVSTGTPLTLKDPRRLR